MATCIAISRRMLLDMTGIRRSEHTKQGNSQEVSILENTLEDIELRIQPSAIDGVKYLGKNKRIEYQRLHNLFILFGIL